MSYVEAPEHWTPSSADPASVFLAGGITGCPDWQSHAAAELLSNSVTVLNPRRMDFPIGDPDAAEEQITWEHQHLRLADVVMFWFCRDAIQPIALYELGAWSMTSKPLAVGCESGYERVQDVVIQTRLARPDVGVRQNFYGTVKRALELADEVREHTA